MKPTYMMYMRDQVCDPYYSQQLKNLGVKKSSTFYWIKAGDDYKLNIGKVEGLPDEFHFEAYSAGELGEMLPSRVNFRETNKESNQVIAEISFMLTCKKVDHQQIGWSINYENVRCINNEISLTKIIKNNIVDLCEANARAKTLIFLLEQKYMTIKEEVDEPAKTVN